MKEKKGKRFSGIIVKVIDTNTLKVRLEKKQSHPLYGKIIKSHKNYLVHVDDKRFTDIQGGEKAVIEECRPLSKNKTFVLVDVKFKYN